VEVVVVLNPAHFIEVPPQTYPSFHTSNLSSLFPSLRFGFGGLDAVVTSQAAREDHLTAKARAPSLKPTQRRRSTSPTPSPSTYPLITPPSSRSKTASLSGKNPQGPSSMDNKMEFKAEFQSKMVDHGR